MQATESVEKALHNDTVFNLIHKKFITLNDDEVKRNNEKLQKVLIETLIEHMKLKDPLFKKAYKQILCFGSFYKNTRVGKPTEFDLNIVLELPIHPNCLSFHSSTLPSFINIQVQNFSIKNSGRFRTLTDKEKRIFGRMITNGSLDPNKFRSWFEGIIDTAINDFKNGNAYNLPSSEGTVRIRKSGPAFTFELNFKDVGKIDVDLVPVLTFKIDVLRDCILKFDKLKGCKHEIWFAIPVRLSDTDGLVWRIAFSHQEKEILGKYGRIKPIIRQLKKLRETQNFKIASYFIETVCLNNIQEFEKDLNVKPVTFLFHEMLKKLQIACEKKEIQWFWDSRYNLLYKSNVISLMNISDRLKNIIKDIEKNIITQSFILAKYILTTNELQFLSTDARLHPLHYKEVNLEHLFSITGYKREYKDPDINENKGNQDKSWRCVIS